MLNVLGQNKKSSCSFKFLYMSIDILLLFQSHYVLGDHGRTLQKCNL